MQSLYGVCKDIFTTNGISGIRNVGGYDIYFEVYTQEDVDKNYTDIQNGNYDANNNKITKCTFGDSDQSKIVLVVGDTIEIPANYTLTPLYPKKSLVIMCNNFINNGTISMTGKGPNVLPHDYYLIGNGDGYETDIIIPAYANNQATHTSSSANTVVGANGNNGVNRQCGSGGVGGKYGASATSYCGNSGSGYAFGGGAGSGGFCSRTSSNGYSPDVNTTYPMRGSNGKHFSNRGDMSYAVAGGGVGNPSGNYDTQDKEFSGLTVQNTGVGGRIIIFCNSFNNNGTISANGVNSVSPYGTDRATAGGASGGGAVDYFYANIKNTGTITANGGSGANGYNSARSGNGGNGAITYTQITQSSMVMPGYVGKTSLKRTLELLKDKIEENGNSQNTIEGVINNNVIQLTYDSDKKLEAELLLSQETDNGLYKLDDGLYVKFATFTEEDIESIYKRIENSSYGTNFLSQELLAILTKDGFIFSAKE